MNWKGGSPARKTRWHLQEVERKDKTMATLHMWSAPLREQTNMYMRRHESGNKDNKKTNEWAKRFNNRGSHTSTSDVFIKRHSKWLNKVVKLTTMAIKSDDTKYILAVTSKRKIKNSGADVDDDKDRNIQNSGTVSVGANDNDHNNNGRCSIVFAANKNEETNDEQNRATMGSRDTRCINNDTENPQKEKGHWPFGKDDSDTRCIDQDAKNTQAETGHKSLKNTLDSKKETTQEQDLKMETPA